jgi:hypothetical protein
MLEAAALQDAACAETAGKPGNPLRLDTAL